MDTVVKRPGEKLRWTRPELSHAVREPREPSGVQQVLAASGVVTAMSVANVLVQQMRG